MTNKTKNKTNQPKLLPKYIESKMTARELGKYAKLQKEWISTGKDMDRAQEMASLYIRKHAKNPTPTQKKRKQHLIDMGLKAEYYAFKKADEWGAFKDRMKKKYKPIRRK